MNITTSASCSIVPESRVRQLRPLVGPPLDGAAERAQRQHGHVELPGERLQPARDLREA
jgi:hypothetical protein